MRPKVKYAVIYRHRNEYSVSVMCRFFEVSRSGYYDFVRRIGQQVHKYKNLLNRQFRTDRPNTKWVTDISYIHTKGGYCICLSSGICMTIAFGITPSMSRKGTPYDNAMAENFFSILKTECIYRHKPNTFREADNLIDRYIYFYNHERIQNRTGVAPLTLRHST